MIRLGALQHTILGRVKFCNDGAIYCKFLGYDGSCAAEEVIGWDCMYEGKELDEERDRLRKQSRLPLNIDIEFYGSFYSGGDYEV